MAYSSGYYHAMDRDYLTIDPPDRKRGTMFSVKDIGMSTPPFKDQLESLQARIKQGASTIELGFSGAGKGSMGGGNVTPEMVPKWERQAIKDLAKINDLRLSTHATFSAGSLAGFAQNHFDEQAREHALIEIKRAIEFAADTTEGGAVVAHLGEFPRSIYESYSKEGFKGYAEEEKHAAVYLVDKRTGEVVTGLTRSTTIPLPVWKRKPGTEEYELDENGRRIPEYDPQTGTFKARMADWDYFENETKEWNRAHPSQQKTPVQMFYEGHLDQQEAQARGMALYWAQHFESTEKALKGYKDALAYYEKLLQNVPEQDRKNWALKTGGNDPYGFIPPETKDPVDYIKDRIKDYGREVDHMRQASISYSEQLVQIEEKKKNTVSMESYAVGKTADTLARAAEFAMARSKHLKEPLFVAPENIFPEQYGAHPQELKQVVLESRKRFVELMKGKGMSESQAAQLASKHIRATFDIGHAHTWKKYYQGNPKKSYEENEADFKKWTIDQVKDLNKAGVIGHVHVSDNFGYEDEHVTPGGGTAPIREFLDEMKKAGIKNIIVEPGHQDYLAMYGGWREFGGAIYGAEMAAQPKRSWSDIEFSYFGKMRTPYFVVGDYAPNQEWSLWSGTPLE